MTLDAFFESHVFSDKSPRIIEAAKLQKKSYRDKTSRILLEGSNSVELALEAEMVEEVLVTYNAAQRYFSLVSQAFSRHKKVSLINEKAANKLSSTVHSPGIYALAHKPNFPEIIYQDCRLLVIVDNIQDPGNLGTLIRLADALGISAMIITGDSVDLWNAKVVRASAGSIFHLPIVVSADISEIINQLHQYDITVLATSGYATVMLDSEQLSLDCPIAWIFGNEARGVDDHIVSQADYTVAIPLYGKAESYNVTTAAAICLYETVRQQRHL